MASNMIKRIIMILLMTVLSFSMIAQEKKFEQKLSWKGDENALEYKVEIAKIEYENSEAENSETKKINNTENSHNLVKSVITTDCFISLNFAAGKYKYRVTAIDLLGRESSVSEWKNFEITKALKPEIKAKKELIVIKENQVKNISIPVDVEKVSEDSDVEFINVETNEIIKGKVDLSENNESEKHNVKISDVKPGKWYVKITNPGGLYTVSDVIEVKPEGKKIIIASEEIIKNGKYKIESDVVEVTEVPEKPKKPYSPFDVNLMIGMNYDFILANELKENFPLRQPCFSLPVDARVSYLPIDAAIFNFGFELCYSGHELNFENKYAKITIDMLLFDLNVVMRANFLKGKLGVCLKGGGGITLLSKNLEIEGAGPYQSQYNCYGYAFASGGLSVQGIFFRHLIVEGGVDYIYVFIPDMQLQLLAPYVCVGVRF